MSYIPSVQTQVVGAGTDYTLTTAYARVDFGTTDPEVTLPTAGTYLISAKVVFTSSALSASDLLIVIFRNATDAVDIGASGAVTLGASFSATVTLSTVLQVTASKLIQLFAYNLNAARGVINSTTSINYVRLY